MSEYTDPRSYGSERYALSGKIMLSAIVILFAVVVLIICLHIYARWYLERARQRQRRTLRNRRRNSRAHIIFATDLPSTTVSHGLDPSLLKLLPTFVYSTTTHGEELLECAVCLSEFEENEKGRLLPKCNHTFHIGCIDMWFSSHSTCPLCRSPVVVNSETHQTETTPIEIVIDSVDLPTSATSSSGQEENVKEEEMGSSSSYTCSSNSNQNPLSVGSRRKGFEIVGVSIDVPRRNESFKSFDEDLHGSPGGGFKSPGGRILSFKRMLSRAGRPSTPMPLSCSSSAIEFDLEKGETQDNSTPPPPPQPQPQPPSHFHDHQRTTKMTTS